jgi:hypothetical protein
MKAFIAALFALLLIAACAETKNTDTATNPAPTTGAEETPEAPAQNPAQVEPEDNARDPEVEKLFTRTAQVKSYSFVVAELPGRVGSHAYYVKGDKAYVETLNKGYTDQEVNKVYLDLAEKTATGYCTERSCDPRNEAFDVDYTEWYVTLPHEWIEQVKQGKKTTSLTFESKPATVVRYEAGGKYYEAYVDNYFGYPLRVAIATDPEMTNIVGGYEYRSMAYNNVKDSDLVFTPE